jgi:hypothetical protein
MAVGADLKLRSRRTQNSATTKGGFTMKKIAIEFLIAAATIMAYVLPVLADGGGC